MASDSPSSQAASTYLSAHTNEMVELQHLNGRLTSYIERLHFLEQQNQTLAAEVKRLRGRKLTRFERLMDQTPQKEDVESRLAASRGVTPV